MRIRRKNSIWTFTIIFFFPLIIYLGTVVAFVAVCLTYRHSKSRDEKGPFFIKKTTTFQLLSLTGAAKIWESDTDAPIFGEGKISNPPFVRILSLGTSC